MSRTYKAVPSPARPVSGPGVTCCASLACGDGVAGNHAREHQDHDHDHGACHGHDHAAGSAGDTTGHGAARLRLAVAQMDCPTEAALLEKALLPLPGVLGLQFDFIGRILTVMHRDADPARIRQTIAGLGMQADPVDEAAAVSPPSSASHRPLIASGLLAVAAEIAHWSGLALPLVALLALVSLLTGGRGTLRKGWIAIRHGSMNIHFLMSLAVTGAMVIGQWPEAAMVLFLFGLAEWLEARSLARAGDAVRALMALAPRMAWVDVAGVWVERALEDVRPGDLVRVRPGEQVPVDGVIREGRSEIDQAAVTGESLPVNRQAGDPVFAGTLNGSGLLQVTVSTAADDSVLARIIHAVREAQGSRAPVQRLVDRFAAIYTPVVVSIAVLFAVLAPWLSAMTWSQALYNALVMLVIACPCALVIATPVTLVSSMASAARAGMLIKGGAALEAAARIDQVAFDKTGTLTAGKPVVAGVFPAPGEDAERILQLAAALDAHSTHPLARALVQAAGTADLPEVTDLDEEAGQGVRGKIGDRALSLGRVPGDGGQAPWLAGVLAGAAARGEGVVVLASGPAVLGVIAFADRVREEAAGVVKALDALGIASAMLTGDGRAAAERVAALTGVSRVEADCLPSGKLDWVRRQQSAGRVVAMVGDGINDAPALAQADLGIAMGAAGSDTALETAGIALMDDRLSRLPLLFAHARRTVSVLRFNIGLALLFKLVFFGLALAGVATLWMAVFADVGASLLVVANGLRLARPVRGLQA